MSLRGPLFGLKKFIENLLEPYGIILKGIKTLDNGQDGTKYVFIWDVERLPSKVKGSDDPQNQKSPSKLSQYLDVERLLQEQFPNFVVHLESPTTIKYVKSRNIYGNWRIVTTVLFLSINSASEFRYDGDEKWFPMITLRSTGVGTVMKGISGRQWIALLITCSQLNISVNTAGSNPRRVSL